MPEDGIDALVELFAAGQHVLAQLESEGGDELSDTIRSACDSIERRLARFGVAADPSVSSDGLLGGLDDEAR